MQTETPVYPIFTGLYDRTDAAEEKAKAKRAQQDGKNAKAREKRATESIEEKRIRCARRKSGKREDKENLKIRNAKKNPKNNPIQSAKRQEARRIAARERLQANPDIVTPVLDVAEFQAIAEKIYTQA
eukprot:692254-Prorocentrum_minimum.AAC.1